MGVGVYLPNVGALEVLAKSRRDFPVALRVVVASLPYHNVRAVHCFLRVLPLLRVGDLDALFSLWASVAKQEFLNFLSRPGKNQLPPVRKDNCGQISVHRPVFVLVPRYPLRSSTF